MKVANESKIQTFNRALEWIKKNTIDGNGITITNHQHIIYPEVTGYYIPTLLQWGERELAISYAQYLCSIQKDNGAWHDPTDSAPYIFDTAQILKGLVAVRDILPSVDRHIIQGCDWMISNVNTEGRLVTPSKDAWGADDTFCSELIHLYCLTPLVAASKLFGREDYAEVAERVRAYYLKNYSDKIKSFSLLSHFYAYVLEGLWDLGEKDIVIEAMKSIEKYQHRSGGIPGLRDVRWVCSTGLFQLALVWYKIGELEKGNRIFDYACSLQNESGGWYGSYPCSWLDKHARGRKRAYYFPDQEISWANKYFLDALSCRMKLEFEKQSVRFSESIVPEDGRYRLIEEIAKSFQDAKICDVGCGRGRYLTNLLHSCPNNMYYAVDLSETVMSGLCNLIIKKVGSLTQIPYEDECFDFVYVCEALEHAINIRGALLELLRVLKPGGVLVVIDKPIEKLGALQIDEWEQWIDDEQIIDIIDNRGTVKVVQSVPYDNGKNDGLFRAWIIRRNGGKNAI